MVPVVVSKASRETVQQHPVMRRSDHESTRRKVTDQRDIKTQSLKERREKYTDELLKQNSVLKCLLRPLSFKTARKQQYGIP